MTGKVLILGGYGNFGKRIAAALIRHRVPVIIAGRSRAKAEALARSFATLFAEFAAFDVASDLSTQLERLNPAVVVNTCGPFQTSNYDAARLCIAHSIHYIDLADGRDFVTGITALNEIAQQKGVTAISGASTVPGLSSAVIEHYLPEFSEIDSLIFGISPGQQAERGFATTQGILTYVGKALKPFAGNIKRSYGWQDIYRQEYPELGKRWMANCDIPDLDLLPAHYGIRSIRFSAGLELGFMHQGLWLLSWAVRLGIPLHLSQHAETLLKISNWFNRFGTADGGMHVILRGKDIQAQPHQRRWFIIAKNGDGPQIPSVPAILLAKQLANGENLKTGAYACVGLVSIKDYFSELKNFKISVHAD